MQGTPCAPYGVYVGLRRMQVSTCRVKAACGRWCMTEALKWSTGVCMCVRERLRRRGGGRGLPVIFDISAEGMRRREGEQTAAESTPFRR